nr:LamG domain-containing protein [Bacteroidota bacterium]
MWQFGDLGSTLGEFTLRTHGSINDRWVAQLWTEDFDINVTGSKNAWTHFAMVYDGTNVKVYANGDLKADQERSLNTISNTFYIGKWGNNYFDGQIDELRVWNTARTQEQIQATMNVQLSGSESGLLAYYQMNEGSGTTITDNSPNSFTGTLVGSPTWVDGVFQPTGSGTDIDPYQIANLNNLYWIAQNSAEWDAHYIQTAAIDASVTSSWSGGGWIPIGTDSGNPFSGNYNGQLHTITGLYTSGGSFRGLYGSLNTATITNLRLINVYSTGAEHIGGLSGGSYNSTVSNCYTNGIVGCSEWDAGGLIGGVEGGTMSNCSSACSVMGDGWIGGLVVFF